MRCPSRPCVLVAFGLRVGGVGSASGPGHGHQASHGDGTSAWHRRTETSFEDDRDTDLLGLLSRSREGPPARGGDHALEKGRGYGLAVRERNGLDAPRGCHREDEFLLTTNPRGVIETHAAGGRCGVYFRERRTAPQRWHWPVARGGRHRERRERDVRGCSCERRSVSPGHGVSHQSPRLPVCQSAPWTAMPRLAPQAWHRGVC